jgi:endonuclease/exonuclease/phosphatase family metal-dependent hydrolase
MEAGVVVGDFNTPADAPELAELRPLFTDAWELARDKQDRSRWKLWQHDAGFTHPAGSPHRRIDQCWVTHGVGVASARVVDAHGASDHLPLVVDLEIPSGV